MPTTITPYARTLAVLTGHFASGIDYATYRPQGTEDYLLILTCSGGGRFAAPAGRVQSRPGDLHLLRPGERHDYGTDHAARRWGLWWIHFTPAPQWLDLLDWPTEHGLAALHVGDATQWADLRAHWRRVHRAALSADALRDRRSANAMEALLLACCAANPRHAASPADLLVRRAVERVTDALGADHSVAALADHVGLSVSQFAHRFRRVMQCGPAAFVEACRLQRATQLLATTSLDVKQIAAMLGFASQFYFSLRFKNHTGYSPTAFRRRSIDGR